jgi:hexosaminidase
VTDFPRFQHRGVMIDTARHFEPVQTIKTVIDSLTYAKFNTLHWHVVDSQSFPFESRSYPNLWNGAYSPQERYTQGSSPTKTQANTVFFAHLSTCIC